MRLPFLAANWKMYKTVHEAIVFTKELCSLVKDVTDAEIVVAPPFTAIHGVAEAVRNTNVGVAGQNMHWERGGRPDRRSQRGDAEGGRRRVTSSSGIPSAGTCSGRPMQR